MPTIGISFDVDDAEDRVAKAGHGEVTKDGEYYRGETVSFYVYEVLRNRAEEDPDATIQRVAL